MFAFKCVIVLMSETVKEAFRGQTREGFFFTRERWIFMPYRPKRPCSHPGCPKLTDGRFCEEHAKEEARRYERYDRDPVVKKRYNRSWKRIRDSYIALHPLCEQCERNGRITPAEEVHHILPLSQGGTHDFANLMALCTPCHSAITARTGGRWGSR